MTTALPLLQRVLLEIVESSQGSLHRFAELVAHHRMSRRANELAISGINGLSGAQKDILKSLARSDTARAQQHDRTLRKIAAASPESIVCIKGTSASHILGLDSGAARASSDVDLLATNPAVLEKCNYKQATEGICHEYGSWTYSGTEVLMPIDLHRYFPTFGFSQYATFGRITQEEIASSSDERMSGVRMPNATMAAVIAACHAYGDFWEHPFVRSSAIRVAEILEYLELRAHHTFDSTLFHDIVERAGAQDSIKFMQHAISVLSGDQPTVTAHTEASRGIAADVTFNSAALLGTGDCLDSLYASRSSWQAAAPGGRLDRRSGSWRAFGATAVDFLLPEPTVARATNAIIIVEQPCLGHGYKQEIRLSVSSGSAVVKYDFRAKSLFGGVFGSGVKLLNFNQTSNHTLSFTAALEHSDTTRPVLLSWSSFAGPTDDSWETFYGLIASGATWIEP